MEGESRGSGKASGVLMALARPWLDELGPSATREDRRSMLKIVSHAWNVAILDRMARSGAVAAVRSMLLSPGQPRGVVRLFDEVVSHKRAEKVRDDRVIGDLRLEDGPDGAEILHVDWIEVNPQDVDSILEPMLGLVRRESSSGSAAGEPVDERTALNAAIVEYLKLVIVELGPGAATAALRNAMQFALGVWNTVVGERLGRTNAVEQLRSQVAQRGDPVLQQRFEDLLAHKSAETEPDNTVILSASTRRQGASLRFGLECCEAPDPGDERGAEWLEALTRRQLSKSLPARRRAKARRSPSKPSVEIDPAWRTLFERAALLYDLAPWRWLGDSELFGVRLPGEREVHWVCVMGAAGQMFGLAVYDGDAGLEAHRQIQADEVETPESAYGVDGWLVTYTSRANLSAPEIERIENSGFRPANAKRWPQFERTLLGRLPRPIEDHQVARVTFLIERALEATLERARNAELFAPGGAGERKVWTFFDGAPRTETVVPEPPPRPSFAPVDRGAVKQLLRSCGRRPEAHEFDLLPWFARVADDAGGEFLPATAALVDSRSGYVLGVRILKPEQRFARAAAELVAILREAAVIPHEVRVRRAWVREAVKPTLDALGVRTTFADELPMLEHFTSAMAARMATERPGG